MHESHPRKATGFILGRSHFGSYAKVVSKDPKSGNLTVDVEPHEIRHRCREKIARFASRFESADNARKLGIDRESWVKSHPPFGRD